MDFKHIREIYKVPAKAGARIRFRRKKEGVIVKSFGCYIGVVFDGDKTNRIMPLHPTWEVEYIGGK